MNLASFLAPVIIFITLIYIYTYFGCYVFLKVECNKQIFVIICIYELAVELWASRRFLAVKHKGKKHPRVSCEPFSFTIILGMVLCSRFFLNFFFNLGEKIRLKINSNSFSFFDT